MWAVRKRLPSFLPIVWFSKNPPAGWGKCPLISLFRKHPSGEGERRKLGAEGAVTREGPATALRAFYGGGIGKCTGFRKNSPAVLPGAVPGAELLQTRDGLGHCLFLTRPICSRAGDTGQEQTGDAARRVAPLPASARPPEPWPSGPREKGADVVSHLALALVIAALAQNDTEPGPHYIVRLVRRGGESASLRTMTFSPDSAVLAASASDGKTRFVGTKDGEVIRELPLAPFEMAYSKDGTRLLMIQEDRTVLLDGKTLAPFQLLALSPRKVLSGSSSRKRAANLSLRRSHREAPWPNSERSTSVTSCWPWAMVPATP